MFYPAALAIALLLCLGSTPSHAEASQEEQNACFNDAQRICPETIPDRDRVFHCLVGNKARLSKVCRGAIDRDVPAARGKTR
jgi:hypothetical protein